MLPVLPQELKDLILEYHASLEEYDKRIAVHEELYLYFREILRTRLNEEFSFIFYPGFYSDLDVTIIHISPNF